MVISSKSTKQEYNFLCHLMFIGFNAFSPRFIIDPCIEIHHDNKPNVWEQIFDKLSKSSNIFSFQDMSSI